MLQSYQAAVIHENKLENVSMDVKGRFASYVEVLGCVSMVAHDQSAKNVVDQEFVLMVE